MPDDDKVRQHGRSGTTGRRRGVMIEHFFHGSATKFEVGDLLLPPSQTGALSYNDADSDAVYVSADFLYAIFIATDSRGKKKPLQRPVWLYQVEPLGELKPHISEILWGFNGNRERGAPCSGQLFTAPRAKILTRTAVPVFFDSIRGDLIENYFITFAKLMTKKHHFRRKDISEEDNPTEPSVWQITRGNEKWESSALPWTWLQNPGQQKKAKKDLFKRLREFLNDNRDEIIDAASETPDIMLDLLRTLEFKFECCADCGRTLDDKEIAVGAELCFCCYIQ